jgi:ubiquinone/menaquinone biosynthesis C-methylase UbiE
MRTNSPIDYDTIAHRFDSSGAHRRKTVDPELVAFLAVRTERGQLSILDIACGTGSQLIVNRPLVPHARLVGLDRSAGMLREARAKMPSIAWVGADAAALPFVPSSFDFITCQFGFTTCPTRLACWSR